MSGWEGKLWERVRMEVVSHSDFWEVRWPGAYVLPAMSVSPVLQIPAQTQSASEGFLVKSMARLFLLLSLTT